MERKCLDCGDTLTGRADKKFCSDLCRNNYNNRQNSDANNLVRNINHILRKNRRILEELTPDGKSKVHKDKLNQAGFNFQYHTHTYTTQTGNIYVFCYEYGYLVLDGGFYALVKRESEKEK
ncbi:MAG: hypothetical protein LC101_01215 [Flavobacteriales bacterium]|nr:hypothetical protein [Flavobacteriales bacterium]MCZ2442390.1 hypothetical protein [Flavobacteriales bacterium]